MNRHSIPLLLLVLFSAATAGAEPAQTTKADSLREKPFSDAKVLLSLKSGQTVDIQRREGAWYFISVTGKTGWVPMLSIRRTSSAATLSVGSLSQTASGRTATGTVVATTGVRGLNEEELSEAKFSEEAVAAAEKQRISPEEARSFARDGGLTVRKVPALADKGDKE